MRDRFSALSCLFGLVLSALAAAAAIVPASAQSVPPKLPAAAFAKLPEVEALRLSPDGEALAYGGVFEGRFSLVVQELAKRTAYQMPTPEGARIRWFTWINNERLLVSYSFPSRRYGTETTETRLYSVDRALTESQNLFRPHSSSLAFLDNRSYAEHEIQIQDRVIDLLPADSEHFLLAIDADQNGEWEVRKVKAATGEFETITEGKDGINAWMTDLSHQLRFGSGYLNELEEDRAIYRNPETGDWDEVQDRPWYKRGGRIIAFAADPRKAYLRMSNAAGRDQIVLFDLISEAVVETIFSNETFDAGGLLFAPGGLDEKGAPVGVRYLSEKPETYMFDAQLAGVQAMVDQALNMGSNRIVSALNEKGLYILVHWSDVDAGRFFLLDMPNKRLTPLFSKRPELKPELMAPMRPVSYEARDGTSIPAYLTLPVGREPAGLPVVVLPHGGPHSRDQKTFDYWVQFLANRGYAVLQPNFRGSTGYGAAFRAAGIRQWGGLMQDDVTDGAKWLIAQGIADPGRICIMGGSYGGYAALVGAALTPDLYRCAISINGVANLPAMLSEADEYIGLRQWQKSIGLEGERAKAVSPYHLVDRIEVPVLLVAARDDRVVNPKQTMDMQKALKRNKVPVTQLLVKSGGHGLTSEEARLKTLTAVEKFLKKYLGPGA